MADQDDKQSNIGVADAGDDETGEQSGQAPRQQLQPNVLPPIYIGASFRGEIFITSFAVDGSGYTRADKQIKVRAGSRVLILGQHLNNFDSVALRVGNAVYAPLNLNIFPAQISFNIKDYDRDLLSGGGVIRLEFLSLFNPTFSARLDNRLIYRTQKQIEETQAQSRDQSTGGGLGGASGGLGAGAITGGMGLAGQIMEGMVGAGGKIIGGVTGGLTEGLSQIKTKPGRPQVPQPPSPSGVSGAARAKSTIQTQEDYDADVDVTGQGEIQTEVSGRGEAETSVEASGGGVSGTAQVGGQTISQSGTAQVTGRETISGTGVLKTTGQVETGATIKTSVSGTVPSSAEVEIKAGGKIQAQGSAEAQVKGELRQKAQVGVEAGLKTEAGITGEAKTAVQPPAPVSGGSTAALGSSLAGAAGLGGTFGTGGTTGLSANLQGGLTAQAGLEGQAALQQAPAGGPLPAGTQAPIAGPVGGPQAAVAPAPELATEKPAGESPETLPTVPAEAQPPSAPAPSEEKPAGKPEEKPKEEQEQPPVAVPPEVQKEIDKLKAGEKPLEALTSKQPPESPGGAATPPVAGGTGGALGEKAPAGAEAGGEGEPSTKGEAGLPQPPSKEEPVSPQAGSGGPPGAGGGLPSGAPGGGGGGPMPGKPAPLPPSKPEKPQPLSPEEKQKQADRLKRAQGRALKAVYQGSSLVRKVAAKKGIEKAEQLVGKASSEIWYWAAGLYFPSWTLTFVVMDIYWILHRRKKELFPMPLWMKATTVVCNLLPIAVVALLVITIWYAGCTLPSKGRLSIIGSGYPGACKVLDDIASAARGSVSGYIPPPPVPPGALCSPVPVGVASPQALTGTCFGQNATVASIIAAAESGGDPGKASRVDICTGDGSVVSWGLFQINLSAHSVGGLNCPGAFSKRYEANNKDCKVVNQNLYQQCVRAATNPQLNIQRACEISGNGSNWNAWAYTKNKCGL